MSGGKTGSLVMMKEWELGRGRERGRRKEGQRDRVEGEGRKGRAVSFHYTFRVHDIALLYHV